jgi:hypothetical protein
MIYTQILCITVIPLVCARNQISDAKNKIVILDNHISELPFRAFETISVASVSAFKRRSIPSCPLTDIAIIRVWCRLLGPRAGGYVSMQEAVPSIHFLSYNDLLSYGYIFIFCSPGHLLCWYAN